MSLKSLHKSICLLLLLTSFACNKENHLCDYSFIMVHYEWAVDGSSNFTSSTYETNPFVISLPKIKKNSVLDFEGDELIYDEDGQSGSTSWKFTHEGTYNTPYDGSFLLYFPSHDSIYYEKWYDGSHTDGNSDKYYGRKIN